MFTIVQNESAFLPIWSRYYQRHLAACDLFVLDHDSTDQKTIDTAARLNRIPVHRSESFDHHWLRDVVERFQAFLLESYDLVLFTEVDEIVAADPRSWPQGLGAFLEHKPIPATGYVRCTGYDIVHQPQDGEPALDWGRPLLKQRSCCRRSERYSKPLLGERPLPWSLGFHRLRPRKKKLPAPDSELLLLHLHRIDYDTCRDKTLENAARHWSPRDVEDGLGYQNRIVDQTQFEHWFYTEFHDKLHAIEPIPKAWEEIV